LESIHEDASLPLISNTTQWFPPNWGLDRIDQGRTVDNINAYVYTPTGANVNVYVIDSGIAWDHGEFGGRAGAVWDGLGGDGYDCNGHGTHVAGIIGGANYGVAKQARLHSVRAMRCDGTGDASTLITAVDWLRTHYQRPAVANLSVSVPFAFEALNQAVRNLSDAGVFVAVAAGNDAANACNQAPSSAGGDVVTVAASTKTDFHWASSNSGPCVDLYAPGHDIDSSVPSGHAHLSGTSMAAPHVAGAAALFKQYGDAPSWALRTWLEDSSTKNRVIGAPPGTPNRLLFVHPDFSRSPTITPISPPGRDEFAYASIVQGAVDRASEYSSSGGLAQVVETSVGVYEVRLPNLGGIQLGSNGLGGIAHVTANGGHSHWCRIGANGWHSQGLYQVVHVACFTHSGLPTKENFSVSFTRKVSSGNSFAYAYASEPTADGYLAAPQWSFNSGGNVNEIHRLSRGTYHVILRNVAVLRGFVMATAVSDQASCVIDDWGANGPDEFVSVICLDRFGQTMDSRFTVSFYDTASLLGQTGFKRAAAWAGQPSSPSYDALWSFNSVTGGMIHINRTAAGRYDVFLPAPVGTDSGSVQIISGIPSRRCKVSPDPLLNKVYVRCYSYDAVLADAPFTLNWVTATS
jgi:hypothetical protein